MDQNGSLSFPLWHCNIHWRGKDRELHKPSLDGERWGTHNSHWSKAVMKSFWVIMERFFSPDGRENSRMRCQSSTVGGNILYCSLWPLGVSSLLLFPVDISTRHLALSLCLQTFSLSLLLPRGPNDGTEIQSPSLQFLWKPSRLLCLLSLSSVY